ncbi:MAG: tyrosine-type recombinase/integrase [Thaumarchaeota archaeon]|nr:tyrosine-type recombinase/integrase [Nitrososphaerota archaeon]
MTFNIDVTKEIDNFLDSVYVISHSSSTVRVYRLGINHFSKFIEKQYSCSLKEIIESIKNKSVDPYDVLKEYVVYLDRQGKKPATIKLMITAVKGFLRHCKIQIYSEEFQSRVRLPKKVHYREEPLTKEIILRLLNIISPKLRTIILVAVASGMRIGEMIQLKLSDIDLTSNPTRIRIRAETTKTREARETFLTQEATRALKDYLTRFFGWKDAETNSQLQNIVIFGRTTRPFQADFDRSISLQSRESLLINSMRQYVNKVPELAKLNENGQRMIHFHAFRKFFRTVVGNAVGRDYAEALIGHHFYLDTYYNLPNDKKRELYLKAEPHLTISDFTKIERDLLSVTERQKEIEESHLELIRLMKQDHVTFPKALEKYIK